MYFKASLPDIKGKKNWTQVHDLIWAWGWRAGKTLPFVVSSSPPVLGARSQRDRPPGVSSSLMMKQQLPPDLRVALGLQDGKHKA